MVSNQLTLIVATIILVININSLINSSPIYNETELSSSKCEENEICNHTPNNNDLKINTTIESIRNVTLTSNDNNSTTNSTKSLINISNVTKLNTLKNNTLSNSIESSTIINYSQIITTTDSTLNTNFSSVNQSVSTYAVNNSWDQTSPSYPIVNSTKTTMIRNQSTSRNPNSKKDPEFKNRITSTNLTSTGTVSPTNPTTENETAPTNATTTSTEAPTTGDSSAPVNQILNSTKNQQERDTTFTNRNLIDLQRTENPTSSNKTKPTNSAEIQFHSTSRPTSTTEYLITSTYPTSTTNPIKYPITEQSSTSLSTTVNPITDSDHSTHNDENTNSLKSENLSTTTIQTTDANETSTSEKKNDQIKSTDATGIEQERNYKILPSTTIGSTNNWSRSHTTVNTFESSSVASASTVKVQGRGIIGSLVLLIIIIIILSGCAYFVYLDQRKHSAFVEPTRKSSDINTSGSGVLNRSMYSLINGTDFMEHGMNLNGNNSQSEINPLIDKLPSSTDPENNQDTYLRVKKKASTSYNKTA